MNASLPTESVPAVKSTPDAARPRRRAWPIAVAAVMFTSAVAGERAATALSPPPPRTYRDEALHALCGGVDVVAVGSSHVRSGVMPTLLADRAANVADSGLNYSTAEVLLRHHWRQVRRARVLLLELDPVPVVKDTIACRAGDFSDLAGWDLDWREMRLSWWEGWEQRIGRVLAARPRRPMEAFTAATQQSATGQRGVTGENRRGGAGFEPRTERLREDNFAAQLAATGSEIDRGVIRQNVEAAGRIVDRARADGLRVVLIRPPHHPAYRIHPRAAARDRFRRAAEDRLREIDPDIEVWDDSALLDDDSDFADLTHVSEAGARQWTAVLAGRLGADDVGLDATDGMIRP